MFGAAKELFLSSKEFRAFLFIPGEYKNYICCFEVRVTRVIFGVRSDNVLWKSFKKEWLLIYIYLIPFHQAHSMLLWHLLATALQPPFNARFMPGKCQLLISDGDSVQQVWLKGCVWILGFFGSCFVVVLHVFLVGFFSPFFGMWWSLGWFLEKWDF